MLPYSVSSASATCDKSFQVEEGIGIGAISELVLREKGKREVHEINIVGIEGIYFYALKWSNGRRNRTRGNIQSKVWNLGRTRAFNTGSSGYNRPQNTARILRWGVQAYLYQESNESYARAIKWIVFTAFFHSKLNQWEWKGHAHNILSVQTSISWL